ncbi:14022_t:CDS:2, partial [Gigaspora rosea]
TNNGCEFIAEVIRELLTIWPDIHIINGRSRYPQSQGLVKHANNILQQKVSKWMEDTQRRNWACAVPLCCYTMNIQTSRPTKNSPYALVFGQNPLHHFMLLKEIKERYINSEDDLPEIESLLGAVALNVEEQQLLELVDKELENKQVDNERINNKRVCDKRVDNERADGDEIINNERVNDNERVDNDKRVDGNKIEDDYKRIENDERMNNDKRMNDEKVDNKRVDDNEDTSKDINERIVHKRVNERTNKAIRIELPEKDNYEIRPTKRHKLSTTVIQ